MSAPVPNIDVAQALSDGLAPILLRHRTSQMDRELSGRYYGGCFEVDDVIAGGVTSIVSAKTRVPWAETLVETLADRIDLLGWGKLDSELTTVFSENHMRELSRDTVVDTLVYGHGYLSAAPSSLMSNLPAGFESPVFVRRLAGKSTASITDPITGKLLQVYSTQERSVGSALPEFTNGRPATSFPYSTRTFEWHTQQFSAFGIETAGMPTQIQAVWPHALGVVPVVRLTNPGHPDLMSDETMWGHSEITPIIRQLVQAASRCLISLDLRRDVTTIPKAVLLGIGKADLVNEDVSTPFLDNLKMRTIGDADPTSRGFGPGFNPRAQLQQLDTPPNTLLREALEVFAAQFSTASGIPVEHLGIGASNVSSPQGQKAATVRLSRRAESKRRAFSVGIIELAEIISLLTSGAVEAGTAVSLRWSIADDQDFASNVLSVRELINAGVLVPRGEATLTMLGVDDDLAQAIRDDWDNADTSSFLELGKALLAGPAQDAGQSHAPVQQVAAQNTSELL